MHIALDARLIYYTSGGISRYIAELATRLPVLDSGNHYSVLHMHKARRTLDIPPTARRANCFTPAHHRLERLALAVEMLPRRPHLLHSPDFIPPLKLGWRAIITIHDLAFLHYPQFLTAESRRYYNHQIETAVATADAILADSEATRLDILQRLNVPPEKVTTVHLAPGPQFTPAPPGAVPALCQRLNIPREYLLFVGTFEPRKNIDGLLRALAQCPGAPPLVLAGRPGWLFDQTEALIEQLGLHQRLHFIPNLPDADLPTLYSGAQMLILPSHYEGFGFPVLEAMACGTPVIISDRASLPEIAGEAALVIDPDHPEQLAEAIQRLLDDSTLRTNLIERGRQQVANFTWERCCRETLAVYRKVLDGIG